MLFLAGKYSQALKRYHTALALFQRLGKEIDAGITLSGSLQSLIYLGQYEQAFAWAQKAREIFEQHRDRLHLARLDINMGNIFYRLDRFDEALKLYQRAHDELRRVGEAQDVAS